MKSGGENFLTGFNQFLNVFGHLTVLQLIEIIFAVIFMIFVYKKTKEYFVATHTAQIKRDEDLKEALGAVRKYPEYRKQSVQIQQKLEQDISDLKTSQEALLKRLIAMEESNKRRDRNKIRDTLLQLYRYYTNIKTNPTQSWTRMESDAFWELFKDYEEAGGDGHMHTVVQPAMNLLTVIEMDV